MYVARADVEQLEGAEGCPGCALVAVGQPVQGVSHSDTSRRRLSELLAATEKGRQRLEDHKRKRRAVKDPADSPRGQRRTDDLKKRVEM